MDNMIYRQMRPEDIESTLALRNEVFSDHPLSASDWEKDDVLASLALLNNQVVGTIPLVPRRLVIAPGMIVRASFENSVGTRADLRNRGIGTGMIASARHFLHERAESLFVYRQDERSSGYRFYVKTGHYDLMYTRCYHLLHPQRGPLQLEDILTGSEAICTKADELLPLFLSTYGQFGGFPQRHEGYWRRVLFSSVIFAEIPTNFYLIQDCQNDGALIAYAIVGIPKGNADRVQIMEMATHGRDLALAARMLARVSSFAAERGLPVEMELSDEDPFVSALLLVGFEAEARGMILMGQLIDPSAFFQQYWRQRVKLFDRGLRVVTEAKNYLLITPASSYPVLTLEMKESTFHRWLLGRIDLPARLREGTVTAYGTNSDVIFQAIGKAISSTSWAYHRLDWL